MKRYFNASVRSLSLLMGSAGGLLCFGLFSLLKVKSAGAWGMMVGAVLTAGFAVFFALVIHATEKRYRGIVGEIGEKIHFTTNANVSVENVSRNGYVYLTVDRLICYFRDRKPYTKMAFKMQDRLTVNILSPISFSIALPDHTFEFVSPQCGELVTEMQNLGWQVSSSIEE